MNSLTPIASLIATINDIVEHDLTVTPENAEPITDIKEALKTIESRSIGLINFVNGYRSFTNIPKPKPVEMPVKDLITPVVQLMKPDLRAAGIRLHYRVEPTELMVTADSELIEMVLINLVKNAMEAVCEREGACIQIHAYPDTAGRVVIEVDDNGPGIIPEALEKIFIPFYTTKKTGSGIGLSLSRQIMRQHGGTLSVYSEPDTRTVFTLRF